MAAADNDMLKMRMARAEDKATVMDIRENVYNGMDIMDEYFDHYVRDPNRRCFICELDGEAVRNYWLFKTDQTAVPQTIQFWKAGFLSMYILDGGESYLVQGGRVREDMEGRGVFRALITHCRQLGRAVGCLREIVVSNSMNRLMHTPSYLQSKTAVCTKQMIDIKMDSASQVKFNHCPEDALQLTSVTDNDFQHYFANTPLRKYLFPGDRVLSDWVPYRLQECNIPLLRQWATEYFTNVRVVDDRVDGLLSSYTPCYVANRIQHTVVDISGTDVKSLQSHMIHHIVRALARPDARKQPIILLFAVDEGQMVDVILTLLQKFDIPCYRWNSGVQENGVFYSTAFETDL